MSVVFRAENTGLGNVVALKALAPESSRDDVFRERFLQESRIAASLNQPNVIPIYDAGPAKIFSILRCASSRVPIFAPF